MTGDNLDEPAAPIVEDLFRGKPVNIINVSIGRAKDKHLPCRGFDDNFIPCVHLAQPLENSWDITPVIDMPVEHGCAKFARKRAKSVPTNLDEVRRYIEVAFLGDTDRNDPGINT